MSFKGNKIVFWFLFLSFSLIIFFFSYPHVQERARLFTEGVIEKKNNSRINGFWVFKERIDKEKEELMINLKNNLNQNVKEEN